MSASIPGGRETYCERRVAHWTVAFYTQTASFPDGRSLPPTGRRTRMASLQSGNIPERVSIIHSLGQPSLTADRYSPSLP